MHILKFLEEDNFETLAKNSSKSTYLKSLYNKVHIFDIHEFSKTSDERRPPISQQSLNKAYELAYEYITLALRYFENGEANEFTDKALQDAAQLLEKLFLNRKSDTPIRTKELL